jgi:TonB family protein
MKPAFCGTAIVPWTSGRLTELGGSRHPPTDDAWFPSLALITLISQKHHSTEDGPARRPAIRQAAGVKMQSEGGMKQLLAIAFVLAACATIRAQQVYEPTDGVTLPTVVKSVKPQYTQEAMAQQIQGTALLECVVRADGSVEAVHIVESLDSMYGLDEQAMNALSQWQFRAGTRDGKAVAVHVKVEMSFTLK